ncbi:uncharacterized protein [Ptychodera flava]|uniref:uncharacterized protein n=1 Tax=Ptychodera flava TaxID=63121 RepID=UPI00396A40CD
MARLSILALLCLGLLAHAYGYIGIEDDIGGPLDGDLLHALENLFGHDGDMAKEADSSDEGGISSSEEEEMRQRALGPIAKLLSGQGDGPLADKPFARLMFLRRLLGGASGAGPLSGLQRPTGSLVRNMFLFRLLGKRMGERFLKEVRETKESHRVYTFAASLFCDCALEYIDDHNEIRGFSLDVVNAVCKHAGKNCAVMYDTRSNCYSHVHGEHSRAGDGLMNHYYDACMTWIRSHERERSVAFTEAFAHVEHNAHFFVKKGNPDGFDMNNIGDKHIGFLNGWVSNEYCLAHVAEGHEEDLEEFGHEDTEEHTFKGAHLHPDQAHYYETREELFTNVESGELAAAFLIDPSPAEADAHGFEKLGEDVACGLGGTLHMMTRKDSNVPEWFSEHLHMMKESGEYYGLCTKSQHEHAAKGDFDCVRK